MSKVDKIVKLNYSSTDNFINLSLEIWFYSPFFESHYTSSLIISLQTVPQNKIEN